MEWKEVLRAEYEQNYSIVEKLLDLVSDDELEWKPTIGNNWMSMGQLLRHLASACGGIVKGFVTEDWGMPSDFDMSKLTLDMVVPKLDQLKSVSSVTDAKARLAADKKTAFEYLDKCTEEALTTKMVKAPLNQPDAPLGVRLLNAAEHLDHHKDQLFYYLKMQGKPVSTANLWGM